MKQVDSQLLQRNYEGLEVAGKIAMPRLVILGKQGAGKAPNVLC